MRIRKRPHPPQIPSDPTILLQASNGREEPKVEERARRRGGWLHPDGDLPIDLHGWRSGDPTLTEVLHDRPSSDPHPTIGIPTPPVSYLNGCCVPPPHTTHVQVLPDEEEVNLHRTWNAKVNSNKRNKSSPGAQVSGGTVIAGAVTGGSGCEEAAAFPLEKRREGNAITDEKPMGTTAKATTALKGYTSIDMGSVNNKSSDDVEATVESGVAVEGNGKKRRSPAVLMEGSRCSRVNGRGWRCYQQTLVGYSLCEHHLGKGRLRSVSSMRGQAGDNKPHKSARGEDCSAVVLSLPQKQHQCFGVHNGVEEEEEEEEKTAKKGRKKIGVVKARSISSLLDESNHLASTMPLPDSDKNIVS